MARCSELQKIKRGSYTVCTGKAKQEFTANYLAILDVCPTGTTRDRGKGTRDSKKVSEVIVRYDKTYGRCLIARLKNR
jgi:hypothetical protein